MSGTTNGTKPASALALLKRADSRWAKDRADDPAPVEYLEHLAKYLQTVAPNAGVAPAVDERELNLLREQAAAAENNAAARRAELDQARAELDELRKQVEEAGGASAQRVDDLRKELGKHADAQESRAKKAETERDKLGEQLDLERIQVGELRKQLEAENREAVRAIGALESARRERDQIAEQLAEVRNQPAPEPEPVDLNKLREQAKLITDLRADYDALAVDNRNMADQLAAAHAQRDSVADHRCVWQWHGPDEPIKPCTCGRSAPRYELREVG